MVLAIRAPATDVEINDKYVPSPECQCKEIRVARTV
jgi:hypothetical protein